MKTALVLFNRDLRVHDNPALAAAARAERTVPLFVLDEALLGSRFAAPNRVAFMLEALHDLDDSLRRAGGRLFVRRGDPVGRRSRVAREAGGERAARQRRLQRLRAAARARGWQQPARRSGSSYRAHPGVTIVPPGAATPAGGDHFKVFTPYHRAWSGLPLRERAPAPRRLSAPSRAAGRPAAGAGQADRRLPLAAARRGRRARGAAADARLPPRRARRIRGAPRRPAGRRDLPAQRPPALRLHLAAGADARGTRAARRRAVRAPALLARLPPPGARRRPLPSPPRLPPARRPLVALEAGARGLAGGPHRLPAGRRGDAPAGRARASCTTGRG